MWEFNQQGRMLWIIQQPPSQSEGYIQPIWHWSQRYHGQSTVPAMDSLISTATNFERHRAAARAVVGGRSRAIAE
ncbi:hypothetical protein EVAR_51320_1 [Eumeta japonica]|uniref:Uncharacterized protein n=1 Tax=Eumeta variegata TaxID=151549 RepID=A0A4C1ZY48_EUMVA|nr:hypothetical protein EVAR_51320_1 [Eumeta japonica]